MRFPIIAENSGAIGPRMVTAWEMRLRPGPASSMRHVKVKVAPGTGLICKAKRRPGSTSTSRTGWARLPLDLVVMRPSVPSPKGPLSSIADTSGFHCGHDAASDQTLHTASAGADTSRLRSCTAMAILRWLSPRQERLQHHDERRPAESTVGPYLASHSKTPAKSASR